MLRSLLKFAREGSIVVGTVVAFVGAPALANPVRVPTPAPAGTTHGASTPSTGSATTSSNSGKSSSGSSLKSELAIGAAFAAAWLAGLPIGPGKTVPMSTSERIIKGLGGAGLIAGGVLALVAAFGSGFSLLGFGEAIAGLGMLAFGLHFGLSALWGKKNDGNLVVVHDPSPGTVTTSQPGSNTGHPGNTSPGHSIGHVPSFPGINVASRPLSNGSNVTRNSSTVPTSRLPSSTRVGTDNTNAGFHR